MDIVPLFEHDKSDQVPTYPPVRDSLAAVTTVGHTLTGLSLAALTLPRGKSLLWYLLIGHFFILFANLPDLPLPGWGHRHYQVSHSLFVTALLASLLALLLLLPRFHRAVGVSVVVAWSLTWLSHMLLDSLYAHGAGIGIFWPLSNAHLALPLPWFETLRWPPITEHNRNVFLTELAVFGTLFALCFWLRRLRSGMGD